MFYVYSTNIFWFYENPSKIITNTLNVTKPAVDSGVQPRNMKLGVSSYKIYEVVFNIINLA